MELPGFVVFVALSLLIVLILRIRYLSGQIRELNEALQIELSTSKSQREINQKQASTIRQSQESINQITRRNEELLRLLKEKSRAIPWLVELIADLHWAQDERDAKWLETKKHPAASAAESVREHGREKKKLRIEKRLVEYRLALMDNLFPWLSDIGFTDAENVAEAKAREATDDNEDPVAHWVSKDEWSKLTVTERNQRALDRYKKRNKTDWEIGRDFERFIGFHWETEGRDVTYHGAIKGFDDFGRDLIVTGKSGKVALIQCKYWSKHKVIPEAAIFQLMGSTVSYYIEQTGHAPPDLATLYKGIQPYLYSSARVAPRIRDIALAMGIKIKDDVIMGDWPMVKCNIAPDGERIYHLPMDQQYDRVKLSKSNECNAWTILEAEANGFRRAKRWRSAEVT
jgi:hypothetical protein